MAKKASGENITYLRLPLVDDELAVDPSDLCGLASGEPISPLSDEKPSRVMDLTDEEIQELYADLLREDENTFAGIVLSDDEKRALFSVLYGKKGYFVQAAHANAGDSGRPNIRPSWAEGSHFKAKKQLKAIEMILAGPLSSHDVPADQRAAKVEKVINSIRHEYSGEHNQERRADEMRRLGIRRPIGQAALKGVAAA